VDSFRITPFPVPDLRHVLAVFIDVLLVLDQLGLELLLEGDAFFSGLGQAIDGVHYEVETVEVIEHGHVEGRGDRAFLLVAANVNVAVIRSAIRQPVDQPRITMEGEDDFLVLGEERIERFVGQAVRMFAGGLQFEEVDDIDHTDFQVGQMFAHDGNSGERFQRGHVATAGHDHIGFAAVVIACPIPDADACGAVFDRFVHRQPLRCLIFTGDHDVDVVAAAQTMIPDREQAVGIRRQIDAHDGGFFVHDVIDEARVLMRETVVHLLPHVGGQQVVQRCDGRTPRKFSRDLQPFGVLVEHRVNDVDEGFVTIEQAVPSGEQIAFKPAFALMLAQHFHDATVQGEELIVVLRARVPLAFRHLEHRGQAIGERFVRAEDAEVTDRNSLFQGLLIGASVLLGLRGCKCSGTGRGTGVDPGPGPRQKPLRAAGATAL